MYSISNTKFEVPCILTPGDKGSWYVLDADFIVIPRISMGQIQQEFEKELNKLLKKFNSSTTVVREFKS